MPACVRPIAVVRAVQTLLNILAGRQRSGWTGDLLANGVPWRKSDRRRAGFVQQVLLRTRVVMVLLTSRCHCRCRCTALYCIALQHRTASLHCIAPRCCCRWGSATG